MAANSAPRNRQEAPRKIDSKPVGGTAPEQSRKLSGMTSDPHTRHRTGVPAALRLGQAALTGATPPPSCYFTGKEPAAARGRRQRAAARAPGRKKLPAPLTINFARCLTRRPRTAKICQILLSKFIQMRDFGLCKIWNKCMIVPCNAIMIYN